MACLLVVSAAAAWTAAVGGFAMWRHQQLLSHRFDLGHMVQAVWSTSEGRVLEFTDSATGEQITRLGVHVDPVLILFAPLWKLWPAPEALVVVQAAALSAGLYPVVRLALKYTGSRVAAALLGAWYLCFPWILWNALNDFHGVTLSIPLLLFAIWFLDDHRLGRFSVVALLALSCGELLGLTVGALGVWYAIHHRRRRVGGTIAVCGVGWTAACVLLVIPAFNDGKSSRYYERFDAVGGSPRGVFTTLLTNPGAIVDALASGTDLRYAALVLLPTGLLAIGSIGLATVALPQLAVNSLSDFWSTTQPMFQYTMPAMAPLIAATVVGVRRFPERFRVWAAAMPLFAALAFLSAAPPMPGGQEFVFGKRESGERTTAMQAALQRIPDGVPVITTNRLGAHLSNRKRVFLFPMQAEAQWAILDARDPWLEVAGERTNVDQFRRLLAAFARDPDWSVIYDAEGVRVYHARR